jgi:hypothetical protein
LREAEDQFIEPLDGIPAHQYLAIALACCSELRELYSRVVDEETGGLLDRSIELIRDAYLGVDRHSQFENLFERWVLRNSRDDGSPGYMNLRFVFEDLMGELGGKRPERLWLDRVSYPFIFAPGSVLPGGPVVQIGSLEIDDMTKAAQLMRSLVTLSERVRSRAESIDLADLEQIRRETFLGVE